MKNKICRDCVKLTPLKMYFNLPKGVKPTYVPCKECKKVIARKELLAAREAEELMYYNAIVSMGEI